MKIGILKEGKTPIDKRVAFTPLQCKHICSQYTHIQIVIQSSSFRSFSDQEYLDCGISIQEDLKDCDVIFGVKEVPLDLLIRNKTYFFFSHTIKKQVYNQNLLQTLVEKNITLIDYECLAKKNGTRVVAFGRWAGIVGGYNALRTYGLKKNSFILKPAHQCLNLLELYSEVTKIDAKNIKILLTGGGRVASGVMELLDEFGIAKVDTEEFKIHQGNCYLQLDAYEYNQRKDGEEFSYDHFFANPTAYKSTFDQHMSDANIFIAGAYWDPKAPALFELKDIQNKAFSFEVIADITCDINGSVPTTLRPTSIEEPFYDYNKILLKIEKPFSNPDNITVMAVDNLPCELPRDASESFGNQLIQNIIPVLAGKTTSNILTRATICTDGALTPKFSYLEDYLRG